MFKQTVFPKYWEPEHFKKESDAEIQKKVDALLAAMTRDEVMNLCHGGQNFDYPGQVGNGGYNAGVPRLGVPEIRMYDGPAGVQSIYDTTGLPVQSMLSASFSPELAYKYGKVEGSENFAISGNTQLGSQYDMVRTPHFDRNRDMLGEDPFLTKTLAIDETKGIQDQHAAAVMKHFAAASIGNVIQDAADQIIDEQTLHELYYPPFEAGIKQGGAVSVMCSYNKTNGDYAAANEYALKHTLRDMWNFKGYVMSDWGSNHSLSVQRGMDMEMPHGSYNANARIELGIQKGRMTWDDALTAAGHVLYSLGMLGYLALVEIGDDGLAVEEPNRVQPIRMRDSYKKAVENGTIKDNHDICLEVARKGIALLKNNDKVLPLKKQDYTGGNSVAMLGLGAVSLLSGDGQERSYGTLSKMESPSEALKRLAPDANIDAEVAMTYFGSPVPAEFLYQDEAMQKPGLIRTWGVTKADAPPSMFDMLGMGGPVGGGGKEFAGKAAADNEADDDSDVVEFRPNNGGTIVCDVAGHETGSFCAVDKDVNFTCGTINGKPVKNWKNAENGTAFPKGSSYTWNGFLTVPEDGEYTLLLETVGGNAGLKISLDGGKRFENIGSVEPREGAAWPWSSLTCTPEGLSVQGGKLDLKAGVAYPVKLCGTNYFAEKDLQIRFAWITPKQQKEDYEKALAAAAKATKVLVFTSSDYSFRKLGMPMFMNFSMAAVPNIELADCQKKLIADVKAVMRPDAKLIAVNNNGKFFAAGDWDDACDGVLQVWTPGQEGGTAVAEALLGIINPSGKITTTVPRRHEDSFITDTPEHAAARYSGAERNGKKYVDYDEGIFTGYRWYDKSDIKPKYWFGHGLSYTSFEYSDLAIDGLNISFKVTNTGSVKGTEIAQVYLGKCEVPEHIQIADKQLCGFKRIEDIAPGETRTVTITIEKRSLCYWDPKLELIERPDGTKDKWVRATGKRGLLVGSSSVDIRLKEWFEC